MKLPLNLCSLLLLSTALTATPSQALPNFHRLMAKGPNGEPSHLEKRLLSANPMHLSNLISDLKGKVTELNTNVPDDHDLMSTPMSALTPSKIYSAFGVVRSGGGLVSAGEDASHPWQPPPPGAKRGPCPGLNTIANHGYLPRSGLVSPIDLVTGTFEGLNLSPDLAGILAGIAFIAMGDLLSMTLSIGDRYGTGAGLNQHGVLEGDASITRQDHYFGNSWDVVPCLVEQFINETNTYGNGNVDVVSLAHSRYRAWDNSRTVNPEFNFNPWRMLVAYGESGFVHEVLRGASSTFDEGMIRSWFLQQRFPRGWRKRVAPFSTPEVLAWAGTILAPKPTAPGISVDGVFIPTPKTDAAYRGLGSFLDPKGNATLGDVYCESGSKVMGFFPSFITDMVGGVGVKGVPESHSCS